jgi:PhzF family phenazine biosynthesis protein
MSQTIYQVDSFTDIPFAGNPAGVTVLKEAADEKWMQQIAAEMNLSETAFLYPISDRWNLRWFTPKAEVDLCGHATLASAHILWEAGYLNQAETARFETKSGTLLATKQRDLIQLDFPAIIEQETTSPEGLRGALGAPFKYVGRAKNKYLVELSSDEALYSLKPDFDAIAKLPVMGVIVTAKSSKPQYDFVSRFFAPAVGVNEDPVTGSAHCALGPYWKWRMNKDEFTAYQASERGGVVYVRVAGDRVKLSGHAITVFSATLHDTALPVE